VADILDRLQASNDKGRLFELVLQAGLKDRGFFDVQRQQSGTQFGFDLIAYRRHADGRPEVWKFECKNTRSAITIDDIAPKLIWHQGITTIDVFVIASVSPLSNSLRHLLEKHDLPMRIEVWSGSFLEQVVSRSRGACDQLGIQAEVASRETDSDCRPEVFSPLQRCFLDVAHQMNPPPAFHYTAVGDVVTKAYSLSGFQLLLTITNRAQVECLVSSLTLFTQSYSNQSVRILVQEKPKGLFEPIELSVSPTTHPGSEVDVLSGKMWRIAANSVEVLRLTLASQTLPGTYWLRLKARARLGEKDASMSSVLLIVNVLGKKDDVLRLKVAGRHYDSPVSKILGVSQSEWKSLKREASRTNQIVFLGPTTTDVIRGVKDTEWVVRALPVKDAGPGRKEYATDTVSRVVHSFGIPVEEELHSVGETIRRISGHDEMQDLLLCQIYRRGILESSPPK
jgi:hypothetical protein